MQVYLQAHPADALGLNYMRQVSALTVPGLGLAWKEFDQQYRRAREILPDMYRWGEEEANSPIWLNAIARGIAHAVLLGQRGFGPYAYPSTASEDARAAAATSSMPAAFVAGPTVPSAVLSQVLGAPSCVTSGRPQSPPPSLRPESSCVPADIVTASSVPSGRLAELLNGYDATLSS